MQNRRALVLLLSANVVSNFASGITMLAIPWYLTSLMGQEGGKAVNAQMMAVITFLVLFWSLYAGTLIDRFNRKRIFQVQQVTAAVVIGAVAFYGMQEGEMPFFLIACVAGVTLFAWTIFYPNLYAFAQELFDPSAYQKVNSMVELQGQATKFFGMLVGSLLLSGTAVLDSWPAFLAFEPWSLSEIFLLDSITYLLSALIIGGIRYSPGAYLYQPAAGVWTRLQVGFRYLRENRPLLIFGIASHTIFLCLLVFMHVPLAIYVSDYLQQDFAAGSRVMAFFEAIYALGAVSAGLLGMFLGRRSGRGGLLVQITALLFLAGAVFTTFSLTRHVGLFLTLAYLVGIANAGVRILRITYIVRIVPNQVIGRVNSFFSMVNVASRMVLLSILVLPFFSAPQNGGHIVYMTALMAVLCLVAGLVMVANFASFDKEQA